MKEITGYITERYEIVIYEPEGAKSVILLVAYTIHDHPTIIPIQLDEVEPMIEDLSYYLRSTTPARNIIDWFRRKMDIAREQFFKGVS